MKITKTASGKKSIKISKSEWQSIGKKAGWVKESDEESGDKQKWISILQGDPMKYPEVPESLKLDKDIRSAAREFFKQQVDKTASWAKESDDKSEPIPERFMNQARYQIEREGHGFLGMNEEQRTRHTSHRAQKLMEDEISSMDETFGKLKD